MKHAFTIHLYHSDLFRETDGFVLYSSGGMGDKYTTYVKPIEVEVECPDDYDPRPAKIKQLRKEENELRAKFAARIKEIEREISQLQAIEYEAA